MTVEHQRKIVADYSTWLTAAEAAKSLGVTKPRVYQLVNDGTFPVVKFRNRLGRPAFLLDPAVVEERRQAMVNGTLGPWSRRKGAGQNSRRCPHAIETDSDMYSSGNGRYRCKACHQEVTRRYYERNREKIRASRKPYYQRYIAEHRDELAAKSRAYYERNREKICAKAREYQRQRRTAVGQSAP